MYVPASINLDVGTVNVALSAIRYNSDGLRGELFLYHCTVGTGKPETEQAITMSIPTT